MPQDGDVFGAAGSGLSTIEKIRLLADWAPLLPLLQLVVTAQGNQAKALAVVSVLRWLSAKTQTTTDDVAIDHLESMLKTPEGGRVIDFLVSLSKGIK